MTGKTSLLNRESKTETISGRWLLSALGFTLGAAVLGAWGTLCLLFWQGNWQLLYHPAAAVTRTPASTGVTFDSIGFAADDTGTPRLHGWWIAASPGARFSHFTVVYLHGQEGNLSDTVEALTRLHALGVNVLAFDYRGYGQSGYARPSEEHWREDAEWALQYLMGTRHTAPGSIVLDGSGLGANLALEVAATNPEVAGVIVESPVADPMKTVFEDARARLVPARLLMRDRFDLEAAAGRVHVPVVWLAHAAQPNNGSSPQEPLAYQKIAAPKMLVWVNSMGGDDRQTKDALTQWLDEIPTR